MLIQTRADSARRNTASVECVLVRNAPPALTTVRTSASSSKKTSGRGGGRCVTALMYRTLYPRDREESGVSSRSTSKGRCGAQRSTPRSRLQSKYMFITTSAPVLCMSERQCRTLVPFFSSNSV